MPDSEAEQWEDEWPPIEEIEALWREDETLARALLFGHVRTDKQGRRVTKYDKLDSKDARGSRMAIARILRSGLPLTQDFRDGLAALFDDTPRGPKRDHVRDTQIAEFVYNLIRGDDGVEDAQNEAADHFGLSPSTIRDIWGHGKTRPGLRETLERIDALLLEVV